MTKRLAACVLAILALGCICAIGASADGTIIDAGPLKLNIVVSETATLFHIVDQLSQNSGPYSNYAQYFGHLDGGLSKEDRELLAQHAAFRKKYDWSLNQVFYTPDSMDSALDRAVKAKEFTQQEAQTEKRVLLHFKARVDKLAAAEKPAIVQFQRELSARKPEIKTFVQATSRLLGELKQNIQLYIIPNPDHNSVGRGYSNDIFMVEAGDPVRSYQWLLRNIVISQAYRQNVLANVHPAAGLDTGTLVQGLAFALVPGILHEGDSDRLAEAVAGLEANGATLKDAYARFSMYGLALRPLVKEALYEKPQTLREILPRAVDVWLVLAELGKARSAERATQSGGGHDFRKDLKHSIFVFGSCDSQLFTVDLRKSTDKHLFGRNHSLESYTNMLTGYSKPGDTIIILLSLNLSERVPAEFADLLPIPLTDIENKLKQGQVVLAQGKAREMDIFLIAAPTPDQTCKEFKRMIGENRFEKPA